jgi:multidrug transporter EmrE-like cation transporter
MNIVNAMPAFIWLIVSGIFFAAGEFLSKKFALEPSWVYLSFTLFAYIVSVLLWFPALIQKNQLSTTGVLWSVISLLMTVLIGLLIFGEKPNLIGVIGIIVAFVAVFLLSIA